jgi:hypothetical protein
MRPSYPVEVAERSVMAVASRHCRPLWAFSSLDWRPAGFGLRGVFFLVGWKKARLILTFRI